MKNVKLTKDEKKKHTTIQKAIKEVVKNKKVAPKKNVIIKEDKVELVQYTIKAVIPTGPYANIQPEIIVKASSLEQAEAYVIPHINKLFGDFLNKSERREVVPTVTVKETPAPITPSPVTVAGPTIVPQKTETIKAPVDSKPTEKKEPLDPQKTNEDIARLAKEQKTAEPLHSIPYEKAKAAIDSCMSVEALAVIKAQVAKSTKLTDVEKNALLMVVIVAKEKTLS
jgi:DNA-directed RNA polymerase subunit L